MRRYIITFLKQLSPKTIFDQNVRVDFITQKKLFDRNRIRFSKNWKSLNQGAYLGPYQKSMMKFFNRKGPKPALHLLWYALRCSKKYPVEFLLFSEQPPAVFCKQECS